VPTELVVDDAPCGIDRSTVRRVEHDMLAALVSSLDASKYASDTVANNAGDPEWLAPHAVAHDALITWACDRGPVVPFPMWVMFTDETSVSSMLEERENELSRTIDRVRGAREFGVRVSADRASIAAAAEKLDSRLADLERQAAMAPPGEAYLLRRKLEAERKAATRDAAARIAEQTHSSLSGHSRSSVVRAADTREPGVLLDGAYLVSDDAYDSFRTVLTNLMNTFEPDGLHFDFKGPWPPYHFVRES
jgi:hypothetical protein